MYQLKKQYVLRKIGSDYFAVAISGKAQDQKMIKLNESGAFLFERCAKSPFTPTQLLRALLEEYDVTEEQAKADVTAFVRILLKSKLAEKTDEAQTK